MTWHVNIGGHVESLEEERAIVDKVSAFIESLASDVREGAPAIWHSWSTQFHGAGSTDVLIHNVESGTEADPNAAAPVTPDTPEAAAPTAGAEVPATPEEVPASQPVGETEATPNPPSPGVTG